MKKLLILLLLIVSCTTTTKFSTGSTYEQLDSILKAEHVLTYDSLPLQDYETKEWFYEYYFIRDSLVIRWIPKKDGVQIIKRIDK